MVEGESDFRNLVFSKWRKPFFRTNVIGVIPVVDLHRSTVNFPNSVDDLIEEPAIVRNRDERTGVIHKRFFERVL